MVLAATNFHPVQPIVEGVETVGEKPKKPKSVEVAPEKAHTPRRPLTIPSCKHRRTQPYSRVIVPGPYSPDRGADGRTCGRLGRGSPRVHRGGKVNGGRTPKRQSRVGGLGCNRVTGRKRSEEREVCDQSSRRTREGGPKKRDHNFSTMPTVLNSDPRR